MTQVVLGAGLRNAPRGWMPQFSFPLLQRKDENDIIRGRERCKTLLSWRDCVFSIYWFYVFPTSHSQCINFTVISVAHTSKLLSCWCLHQPTDTHFSTSTCVSLNSIGMENAMIFPLRQLLARTEKRQQQSCRGNGLFLSTDIFKVGISLLSWFQILSRPDRNDGPFHRIWSSSDRPLIIINDDSSYDPVNIFREGWFSKLVVRGKNESRIVTHD